MQLEIGKIYEGKVTGITKFGAFIELEPGVTGMVHISEVSSSYIKEIRDHLQEKQMVKVKVLKLGDDGKISLSIKKAEDKPQFKRRNPSFNENNDYSQNSRPRKNEVSFEDMLNKFKQSSEEKMGDLKKNMDGKRGSYSKKR